MNYRIVPMDKGHLNQVVELSKASFTHPWSAQSWEEALYNDSMSVLVAQGEDETVLAVGAVRAVLDEGCLEMIAVRPDLRRQGMGEDILGVFVRFAATHLAFLTLEVRESNQAAIGLYEKLGFAQVGRRKNYYQELGEDAILLTKYSPGHEGQSL